MKTRRIIRQKDFDVDLNALLDELGVGIGEEFMISGRSNYEVENIDQNQAVKGRGSASYNAMVKIFPHTGQQRRTIIDSIAYDGPATRRQLSDRLGISMNSIRPRILEALDGGWIEQINTERPEIFDVTSQCVDMYEREKVE